jgi:DNA-binding NarL/FixJ family response regulator
MKFSYNFFLNYNTMFNIIAIHPDVALIQLLESVILQEPDWQLLLHEANYETFQDHLSKIARIDIAILDSSEIHHIPDLKALSSEVKIIVLCDVANQLDGMRAFHDGAMGYLNKALFKTQISYYIKSIIAGGALISPTIARYILDSLIIPAFSVSKDIFQLTPREVEVMNLFSQGYSQDSIANTLGISKHVVGTRIHNIYTKIKVSNRKDAVRKWNNSL